MSSRRIVPCAAVLAILTACAPGVQQQIAIGKQAVAEIDQTMPVVHDPEIQATLNQMVAPLRPVVGRNQLPWSFQIINSDQVNAFAVPGGHIYIFRGLIEATDSYAELMAVIGHEMAHVEMEHAADQMGKATAASTGVGLLYALLGRQPGTGEQLALNVAAGAVFAKFSRDDEREADSVSVQYLTQAGVNPDGIPDMFRTLLEVQEDEPGKVEMWFSSHPGAEERVQNTTRIIANSPAATAALKTGDVTDPDYAKLKRLLETLPPPPE